ncbi:cAMP-regulated phosphoprotein 19-related protein [Zea mays]|uniref:cAMP-regulated phosphoprotein 19-related protein n=1 Tax=Zea mays TaxID=4577 RepID=A0A1D6KF14_MAIZE|nr:cAMP-regulated phosphoprotein 19-related protein [Zea mays]ONM01734.1 cAMP-regulated phosphoprotein 19-related protein [Zea mays]ONM01735.1 cAMP-regulated phosphoprotein 19-related protein [Zea mays]
MSGMASDDSPAQVNVEGDVSEKKVEVQDQNEVGGMPSRQEEDHERAYFDSADWALGKQGGVPNKPKGPLEALRPKLQPTQQNARARRTSYASADSDGTPPFLYYLIGNLSAFIFPVCTIDDCFFPPSVADTLNLSPEDLVPQGEPSQQGEPVEDKNKE